MPANLAGLLRRRDCPRATTGDACGVRLAKAEAAVTRRSLRETGRPRTADGFPARTGARQTGRCPAELGHPLRALAALVQSAGLVGDAAAARGPRTGLRRDGDVAPRRRRAPRLWHHAHQTAR